MKFHKPSNNYNNKLANRVKAINNSSNSNNNSKIALILNNNSI